jgi:hypothetical protein
MLHAMVREHRSALSVEIVKADETLVGGKDQKTKADE